jgi:hypothetical protein
MNQLISSRIFISYSHRGNGPKWKVKLLQALHVFEQHHLLDVWQDGKIRNSSYWEDDIEQAMSSSQLAVILLTHEALESQFILEKELPFLRKRQIEDKLPIFPVICEPCNWKNIDWLRATQAPNTSNPLSGLSESLQNNVFRNLATDIALELSSTVLADLSPLLKLPSEIRTYLNNFPITSSSGQREEKLIGREQELALLDLAFAQPHTAIVSLVAWGGVGKTMLVQHWVRRLQREGWFGLQQVYAWSFYSQGTKEDRQASEDTFLANALEWFGVQCEPTLSPWDKGRLLADAISCKRTLLILDGIEPLQYPPGPMGGQLRAPGVQSLLKQLARKANSKTSGIRNQQSEISNSLCLVTTREPLTDLADFQRREGSPWGSVLRIDLGNLTEEAGAALLHHAGTKRAGAAEIKPDDKELLIASREVNGHALTLNLLGRFLARAHGGDIRRRDLVKFEEADQKEQGGTTFKMLAAFENWFARSGEFGARQLAVLRMLGLFDRPADAGCISALRKPPAIDGLSDPLFIDRLDASSGQVHVQPLVEEDWNTVTSFLADFGLVLVQTDVDNSKSLFDCHPLIREYFNKQLRDCNHESWRSAHARLCAFVRDSIERQPSTMRGIDSLCQAVSHGCYAGMLQEVFDTIYWPRIVRGSEYFCTMQCGAYSADLYAISGFFRHKWTACWPDFSLSIQARLLAIAGYDLRALGQLDAASEPMRIAIQLRVFQNDWVNAAVCAGNLSELELLQGHLADAFRDAEQSVSFAERAQNWVQGMRRLTTLAVVQHQAGESDLSQTNFEESESMQEQQDPQHPISYSVSGFRYCDFLLSDCEYIAWNSSNKNLREAVVAQQVITRCAEVEKRASQTLVWAEECLTPLDVGLDHLTIGRAALYRVLVGDGEALQTAFQHIGVATDSLFISADVTYLAKGLLSRAWLRSIDGDFSGARADLDEAWDIAERGPMRLHMADIHLYRARLFFREKIYPWKSPQDDLAEAEKLINECGYHRRDEELEDAKSIILNEKQ